MTVDAAHLTIPTTYYSCDKRPFDICDINGAQFLLVHRIVGVVDWTLKFSKYNIVLLSPLTVEKNLHLKAISVISLANIQAEPDAIKIKASGKFITVETLEVSRTRKITASASMHIPPEHRELICQEFQRGIREKSGEHIVDALTLIFNAVNDSTAEIGDLGDVLSFFNIPVPE